MTSAPTMDNAGAKQPGDGDLLPKMTQVEYSDQLETHNILIRAKSQELTELSEQLKMVREKKEPLAKAKDILQDEINKANKAINEKSEEVTLIKQKLRYHSVKQTNENIERLEYQLRNNRFKPREEQKILNEIGMLQRSLRTLREYEAKQAENKKYRAERTRLIDERNNNFAKIRALYEKEDEIKKAMAQLREVISINKKAVESLKQMRPILEQAWLAQKQQIHAARQRRIDEKKRVRQDQIRERQEERRKLWEEYEASREPYEDERNLCRLLMSYLQASVSTPTPVTPGSASLHVLTPGTPSNPSFYMNTESSRLMPHTPTSPAITPTSSGNSPAVTPTSSAKSTTVTLTSEAAGSFYKKSKDEDEGYVRVSKREKARAKRQQKLAKKVKELRHTPDVLRKFSKLSISPPKNTDEIPTAIIALQDSLQHFNVLALSKGSQKKKEEKQKFTNESTNPVTCTRPSSLTIRNNTIFTPAISVSTVVSPSTSTATNTSEKPAEFRRDLPSSPVGLQALGINSLPAFNIASSPTSWATTSGNKEKSTATNSTSQVQDNEYSIYNGIHLDNSVNNTYCSLPMQGNKSNRANDNESFFSLPLSYPSNLVELNNNNNGRSYASVTAKIKAGVIDL